MSNRPRGNAPDDFLGTLQSLLEKGWPLKIEMAGLRAAVSGASDPELRIDAHPRLSIMLRGRQRYSITAGQARREIVLRPGHCLFWPGGAWSIPHWEAPCLFFGIVFRSSFTRYIMVDFPGGEAPLVPTPWSCHLPPDAGGELQHILRALESHAARGAITPAVVEPLVSALLHLAAGHLARSRETAPPAEPTLWQRVLDHLHAHYGDSQLSRASVAEALGVHPNYLSLLARKQGHGFHEAMEEIRLRHARQFLTRSGLPLEEIHRHCGYASASYFQRAFRRVTGVSPGQFARRIGMKDGVEG